MSKCTQCLQRLCHRHPLQDHGEREREIKNKLAGTGIKKSFNEILKNEIERLEALAKGTGASENQEYRSKMDQEREKLTKQETKKISQEHEILAKHTGLHGSVLSIMMKDVDDEESVETAAVHKDKKSKKEKKKKRKKDDEKEKKRKKEKKSKKEKKHKKEKKEKLVKKKRKYEDDYDTNSDRIHESSSSSDEESTDSASD